VRGPRANRESAAERNGRSLGLDTVFLHVEEEGNGSPDRSSRVERHQPT